MFLCRRSESILTRIPIFACSGGLKIFVRFPVVNCDIALIPNAQTVPDYFSLQPRFGHMDLYERKNKIAAAPW